MGLSDAQLRKIRPRESRFELTDGKGLVLLVLPSGRRSWLLRYQFEGKPRRITLGEYPDMSLLQARNASEATRSIIKQGLDPALKRTEEKTAHKTSPTVSDLLTEYWDMELKESPSGKERRRLVEKDALPLWGKRKVAEITRRDAALLLDGVRARAPVTGNRLQGVLVRMFNFAAERGVLEHSPLMGLRKKKEQPRSRVLTDNEIKLLWDALALDNMTMDIYRVSKLALKMILLTGQRPGEICGMTWAEINGNIWNIPAGRMKSKESHTVPLNTMALDIIAQARCYSPPESAFVFKSSHFKEAPITPHSLSKAILRHWPEMGITERFTPHDLRRTLRTRLAELGVSDIIGERVLGHKLQGILGVYNRHDYDQEKRQALEQWERRLRRILGLEMQAPAGKIIELRTAT
ncbi:MAG: tyrosine-type recombinase/integrase [Desulfurivibrionaceae bacterium]|nr:tyrosine-type recombinase/integrase [Desulfurivibrionaceae bacterium]